MDRFQDLDKGQIAYRDIDGSLMILPVDNQDVRDAFIRRLMLEYVEDRNLDELLERFKQAGQDIGNENTKPVEELKN